MVGCYPSKIAYDPFLALGLLKNYCLFMLCPFCDLDHLRPRILEERSHVFILFSDPRLMPGHLLVIPKRHVEHLADLAHEERADLFDAAIEYQSKMIGRIAEGCDINQHDRPFLTQSRLKVDHVHVHLQPRGPFDDLYQATRNSSELYEEVTAEEQERIVSRFVS